MTESKHTVISISQMDSQVRNRLRLGELSPNYTTRIKSNINTYLVQSKARVLLQKFKTLILRSRKTPPSQGGRTIPIQLSSPTSTPLIDCRTGKPYCNNEITSSIYTVYSFVPRQLMAQFSKLANLYVLKLVCFEMNYS